MKFIIFCMFLFSLNLFSGEMWLSASAHATGALDTNWRTDVSIFNNNSENLNVTVYFLQSGVDKSAENLSRSPINIPIPSNNQVKIDDILKEKFGIDQGSGALMFSSEKDIMIISRTYNKLPEKEYGQFIPGQKILEAKKEQKLIGAVSSTSFRTNFGILNPSKTENAQINLKFLSKNGNQIKETNLTLNPWVHIQFNDLFSYFGISQQEDVSILISSNLEIFCYLSVVDNQSSDPIFIPGLL